MFYLVYCTCVGIIPNIYHVVATMLCFHPGKLSLFCWLGIYYDLDGFPGDTSSLIQLPVYLNSSRANLLFTVSVIVHHRHCISVALQSLECVITVIIFNLFSKSQWRKCDLKVNLPLAAGQKKTDFHERGVAIIASTALNWAHTANFHIFWHQCVDITIWSAMRNWSNLSFGTGTILHTVMHLLCARTWFSLFLYNHSSLCIENKYSTKLTSVRNCWCHAYSLIHIKRFQASIN